MAIKENYNIKTNDRKYIMTGQSGVFKQEDYIDYGQEFLENDEKTHRFLLIDFWQLGVFGSENCNQTWDDEKEINIVTEEDVDKYTEDIIKFINDGLFDEIKQAIISEIEEDGEETVKLVR